jgi:hypothetical protein
MQCRARDVRRMRCRSRPKHRFHSPEPSRHTLVQEQGKANAAALARSSFAGRRIPRRSDDLGASQLVLNRILRDVGLWGLDGHRRFFSSCRR